MFNHSQESKTIVISGSSGFLGSELCTFLQHKNHTIKRLVRRKPTPYVSGEIYWNPLSNHIETYALEGADAVIHLAGHPIAQHHWSKKEKELILQSRIQSTHLLSETIAKLNHKPKVFISASAIGFYGDRDNEELNEESPPGTGFLASVCREWESATWAVQKTNVRLIHLRNGAVLSPTGGLLKKLLPWFRLGLGAQLGTGSQWISWIALADWIKAIEWLLFQSNLEGALNLVAPNPTTQLEFARTLAHILHRPLFLKIPNVGIRFLYGQMGQELLLSSCKAYPQSLLQNGFQYQFPDLQSALENMLPR